MSGLLESVRRLWDAYEHGGFAAGVGALGEDVVWVPGAAEGELRGAAEIRAHLERLRAEGVRLEAEPQRFEVLGDGRVVVVSGSMRVIRPTGLADSPVHWVYRGDGDGRIVRIESYGSRDEAYAAAADQVS
jgi:ketosteroid isomerase-like protein